MTRGGSGTNQGGPASKVMALKGAIPTYFFTVTTVFFCLLVKKAALMFLFRLYIVEFIYYETIFWVLKMTIVQ